MSALERPGPAPLSTASPKMPRSSLSCNNRENVTQRKLQGEAILSSRTRATALEFRHSWVNGASLDFDFWAVHFGLGFPEYLYFQDLFRKEKKGCFR